MDKGKIQNPLTIIAIFAGIAEVTGTVVLLGLPLEIQQIFVWFVIAFPAVLVIAFFLVLVFKHKVLYAPSDFQNEDHFIQLLMLKDKKIEEISKIIDEAKEVTEAAIKEEPQSESAMFSLNEKLSQVKSEMKSDLFVKRPLSYSVYLDLHPEVMDIIQKHPEGLTRQEIDMKLGGVLLLTPYLQALVESGKLIRIGNKYYNPIFEAQ